MWYTEKSSAVNNSLQTAKLDSQKTIVYWRKKCSNAQYRARAARAVLVSGISLSGICAADMVESLGNAAAIFLWSSGLVVNH